jgi:hypothetical protein
LIYNRLPSPKQMQTLVQVWEAVVEMAIDWHMPASRVKAAFIEPMLLLRKEKLPEGDEWLYEIKLDGYRAIAFKSNRKPDCVRATTTIWSAISRRRSGVEIIAERYGS